MTESQVLFTYVRCLVLFDYNFTEFHFQSKQQNLMGYFYNDLTLPNLKGR